MNCVVRPRPRGAGTSDEAVPNRQRLPTRRIPDCVPLVECHSHLLAPEDVYAFDGHPGRLIGGYEPAIAACDKAIADERLPRGIHYTRGLPGAAQREVRKRHIEQVGLRSVVGGMTQLGDLLRE